MTDLNTARVAVAGCGYWGKNLVRNFHDLGALAAVCDPTEGARRFAKEIAPGVRTASNLDDLLGADIDALVISTPAETHYELALKALKAGKDVLVEKPLALDIQQAYELVETAYCSGRILMVGHILEYHPAIARLRELVEGGALGEIYYVYSNRVSLGKVRREENILWSFAPHDIAVIIRLLGSMPYEVVSCGGSYLQPNIADVTVTHLMFDRGVRAHIHVSWLHPFKEQRLVVIGSEKMATFDDVEKKLILHDQRVEIGQGEPVPVRGPGTDVPFDETEPLKLECQAFLHAINSRIPPLTDGRSGLRVLNVLQASQRSLELNGRPVEVYPDAINLVRR